ncbi:IS481 family transposase [Pseudonocardia endophytica]|uniref:Transposase IS481 family protein n=1 Tax=Pseudonocardia endophytica TaxID=401976 RepID=A0A4V2PJ98_PSEEN|nr:IS481 family transposase [Pseudonocardia endophytica]TCK27646.1 transposase IS481 family protein [Pseudonocardia endophytica]
MAHRNARLTVHGRMLLVERVRSGRPVAHVAAELGVSRATGYKWWGRYRREGPAGLADRSSRPHRVPARTSAPLETLIVGLRRERKLGPHRIGPLVGLAASTVHAVLVRRGLSRLAWVDRPTGQVIRRYERDRPGELVHVDVKKLGRLRDGGGWRAHGRDSLEHRRARYGSRVGFDYIHAAIDDHTRLAYAEVHLDEQAATCAAFLRRAAAWFAAHGIARVERVMTDNALVYRRSAAWRDALAELGAQARFTRRYRPQTNGKAERFNRTMLDEWAYQRPFASNAERAAQLPAWLHTYNHHRSHTALGGHPPITRVNNPAGTYS